MEGEMTMDIRITCEEQRKVSRTTLIVSGWTEDSSTVTLTVEKHDLEKDEIVNTKVEVPLPQMVQALDAVTKVLLG
jgi:hypothetical protein